MATVKISQLSELTNLGANTSATVLVGVDLANNITGRISATTVSRYLFANNILNVGESAVVLPNVVAQFSDSSNNYIQTNLQNFNSNGTSDYVVTGDTGSDVTHYIDLGITNSTYNHDNPYNSLGTSIDALDGYLYVQGNTGHFGGNLIIGTTSTDREIKFLAGGVSASNLVAKVSNTGIIMLNNLPIEFSDGTKMYSLDYTQAAFAYANTSNTWLQANVGSALAVAKVYTDTANNFNTNRTDTANTWLTNRIDTANTWLTNRIDTANTFLQANTGEALAVAKVYTDTANTSLKSYSDNKFLANTTGTFAGTLTLTGEINISQGSIKNISDDFALQAATGKHVSLRTDTGSIMLASNGRTYLGNTVYLHNASLPGNTQHLVITSTVGNVLGDPSNPGYTIHTAVDGGNRIVAEAFSNTATDYSSFIGRRARGTAANPLAVQNGDTIVRFGGNAYGNTKFSQFADARIEFIATENHTDTAKGTKIRFMNTENGSNISTEIATFNGNTVTFSGSVNPTKGFILTPNVSATVTSKTIDFGRDNLLKFDVNTDATVTLTNYVAGKVVEVWITNSAAQNKVITHGCLSNNSTSKATSFTLLSQSCAYLRYFSIDGDQANTFVSITA